MSDLLQPLRDRLDGLGLEGWAAGLTLEAVLPIAAGLAYLFFGWLVARWLSAGVHRFASKRFSAQAAMIARLSVFYSVMFVAMVLALRAFGLDISVLLGAAGVLTVALGFAAQTSASNVISGVFLLGEQPFVVGDVIKIAGTTGEVVSINLMSVQLRTFANLLVRVPNEALLKSEITNLTHFPIRRVDLWLTIPYGVSLERVRQVLEGLADQEPLCLDEPRAMAWFDEFTPDGVRLQFSLWASTPNYFKLRTLIPGQILQAFDDAGFAMAAPRRHLWIAQGGGESSPILGNPVPENTVADFASSSEDDRK